MVRRRLRRQTCYCENLHGSLSTSATSRGGEENGGEKAKEDQAGPSSPIVGPQTKPGPRCSKGKERERAGRMKKEKDWSGRRILSSEEEEGTKGGKEEEDVEYVPESPAEILEFSRAARESARMKLRSVEEAIDTGKPRVIQVTTLEGPNRIRMKSPGVKRGREEKEEETDAEEESGMDEGDNGSSHSSRDSSALRSGKKRKKIGRPAKYLGNEGLYTALKIRQRAKERELERVKEKEQEILDPEVKATSSMAEKVDRQAVKILDSLQELPNPELAERALRAIEAIKKVASSSKNLKGAFVGALWKSSEELTALSLAYSSRLREKDAEEARDGDGGEMNKLRAKLSAIRTEHALLRGENSRLREQVEDLSARVVLGETAKTPLGPSSSNKEKEGRKRRSRGIKTITADSSSTDIEMEGAMERNLSREAKWRGIKARREVEADLAKGTMPPAIRPAIKGRTMDLDGGQRVGENPLPPPPPTPTARLPTTSSSKPPGGLSQEDIIRLIQTTISQLLPQLGGGSVRPEGTEEGAQPHQGPQRKDPAISSAVAPAGEAAGDGQGGVKRKKKKKKKGKKGKGGEFPSKGVRPPRVLTPPHPHQRRSRYNRGPPPFLGTTTREVPPLPEPDGNVRGGQRSQRVPGKRGPK